MIIRPYSDFETQAKNAPTVANYPGLKHFFDFGALPVGLRPTTTLCTDSIGGVGVGYTVPQTVIDNVGGLISVDTSCTVVTAGAWASPVAKKVLAIFVGTQASTVGNNITIGETAAGTDYGFTLGCGTTSARRSKVANGDGTPIAVAAGIANNEPACRILVLDWGANMTLYVADADIPTATVSESVPITAMNGLTFAGGDDTQTNIAAGYLSMLAIFHLTTLPPAAVLNTAASWMADNRASRVLYPPLMNYV